MICRSSVQPAELHTYCIAGSTLQFEFTQDLVMIVSSPFPALEDCLGSAMSPEKLLQQLRGRGLPLLVPREAVSAAGLSCKVSLATPF